MKLIRNFTGDDLAKAESDMNTAWNLYQERLDSYNYSLSVGHDRYARRVRLPEMNVAKDQYDLALKKYNDILDAIAQQNNTDFQAVQQGYVSDNLQAQTAKDLSSSVKNNYTTLIYIGIAVLLAYFLLK